MKTSGWTLALGLLGLLGLVVGVGWSLWKTLTQTEAPAKLFAKWVATGVVVFILYKVLPWGIPGLLIGLILGLFLSVLWAPHLGALISKPITGFYDGGVQEPETRPLYSIAEARRKQGKYSEAIAEIRTQLQRFPDDFAGLMMLAEIQAENLYDLSGVQDTIDRILSQERPSPKNIAFALNRLADWHVKFGQDRESARTALERITLLLPDTEQAQMARQRLAHLTPEEMIIETQEPRRFQVPHHEEYLGLRPDSAKSSLPAEENPVVLASTLVKHLEKHPHDYEARETLALIYTHHYQRLDLASDQLEQLIAIPHQPAKQVVHWLNLLADIQVRLTGDAGLARHTLQRIVDRFPKTAAAENALNRMAYLNLELRPKHTRQAVKLGPSEQNIGLKEKKTNEGDAGQSAYQSR